MLCTALQKEVRMSLGKFTTLALGAAGQLWHGLLEGQHYCRHQTEADDKKARCIELLEAKAKA